MERMEVELSMKAEVEDPLDVNDSLNIEDPLEAEEANEVKRSFCEICERIYSNNSNLKKHVKKFHPTEEIYLKSLIIKGPPEKRLCEICGKHFKKVSILNRHTQAVHNQNKNQNKKSSKRHVIPSQKCALCELYSDRRTLIDHYSNDHDVDIESDCMWFDTLKEFFDWKETYENETASFFTKAYNKTRDGKVYKGFQCDRSGVFQSNSRGRRRLKFQGSKKINGFCPAFISLKKATENNSKYSVQVVKTHVGHDKELDHLNLKKSERQCIAKKIALNIPFDKILEEFRCAELKSSRFRLLTRKDLHNIKASLKNKKSSVGPGGISETTNNPENSLEDCSENEDDTLDIKNYGLKNLVNKFENVDDFENEDSKFEESSESDIEYKCESLEDSLFIKSEDESEDFRKAEPNNANASSVEKRKQKVFNNLSVIIQKVSDMDYKQLIAVEKSINPITPMVLSVKSVKSSVPVAVKKIKFVRSKNIECQRKVIKIKRENVDKD